MYIFCVHVYFVWSQRALNLWLPIPTPKLATTCHFGVCCKTSHCLFNFCNASLFSPPFHPRLSPSCTQFFPHVSTCSHYLTHILPLSFYLSRVSLASLYGAHPSGNIRKLLDITPSLHRVPLSSWAMLSSSITGAPATTPRQPPPRHPLHPRTALGRARWQPTTRGLLPCLEQPQQTIVCLSPPLPPHTSGSHNNSSA